MRINYISISIFFVVKKDEEWHKFTATIDDITCYTQFKRIHLYHTPCWKFENNIRKKAVGSLLLKGFHGSFLLMYYLISEYKQLFDNIVCDTHWKTNHILLYNPINCGSLNTHDATSDFKWLPPKICGINLAPCVKYELVGLLYCKSLCFKMTTQEHIEPVLSLLQQQNIETLLRLAVSPYLSPNIKEKHSFYQNSWTQL